MRNAGSSEVFGAPVGNGQCDMRIYLGILIIAFTTLALEITLARMLSVLTWYHLAFFAISTALLGMTAGATAVYLKPDAFADGDRDRNVARACVGFSIAVPLSLALLCLTPLEFAPNAMSLLALMAAAVTCSLPFFFSGIVITVGLTRYPLPVSKLYASDLVGASLGCLGVLWGLELLDAPSLILVCGSLGTLASLFFYSTGFKSRSVRSRLVAFIVLLALGILNNGSSVGIRPLAIKGRIEGPENYVLEKWNSFSRVAVYKPSLSSPQYWGASVNAPRAGIRQYRMNIDGDAGTTLRSLNIAVDLEHLRFDVTNVAYYLRPDGGACIIGVGGGRDVQSALWFGHERVLGIEVNPIFIDLLRNEFREFAGLADHDAVTLVADDARSHLSHIQDRFEVIQLSMVDTWAATAAGAFSLSENALYTVEAWKIFMNRLNDDGVLTVSRWHSRKDLGETGRVLSLAVCVLLEAGVAQPSNHLAVISTDNVSTLILAKSPFKDDDVKEILRVCAELRFQPTLVPGTTPEHKVLRDISTSSTMEELSGRIENETLNYSPPTDENPYFFNMLRLSHWTAVSRAGAGVLRGNLVATLSLGGLILALLILAMGTVVIPLKLKARYSLEVPLTLPRAALYFSLIGAGFMFVEIALMQRLSVFLGHPVYALGVILFTLIGSTGLGSFLSDRLPLSRPPGLFLFPWITALAILLLRFFLPGVLSKFVGATMQGKIIIAIVALAPLGILLGFFFPTGMKMARKLSSGETPWYWALNGIFGVLSSAVAVFVSIYSGISTNFYFAALCYASLPFCLYPLHRALNEQRSHTP